MTRTFGRIRKQVDQRVKGRSPRGGLHLGLNEVLTYLFELKTFHVKHYDILTREGALSEDEKALLAAGEHFEEGIKKWLAGE